MKAPGFTLVEMLVALLIFAMLSAVGVTVMAYAAGNQGVVKARMDRLGELQSARSLLKADLAQAAVRRVRGRDGNPARNAFIGSTAGRSEEHTSELTSLMRNSYAVFCLKTKNQN